MSQAINQYGAWTWFIVVASDWIQDVHKGIVFLPRIWVISPFVFCLDIYPELGKVGGTQILSSLSFSHWRKTNIPDWRECVCPQCECVCVHRTSLCVLLGVLNERRTVPCCRVWRSECRSSGTLGSHRHGSLIPIIWLTNVSFRNFWIC